MKFEMLEKFKEQKSEKQQAYEKLAAKEQEAREELARLKAEYETAISAGVKDGRDNTETLDRLSEEIEKAEKTVERRKKERQLFSHVVKDEISAQDVVDAWNSEFVPQFREERFNDVLQRLLDVKREYAKVVMDYYEAVNELETERNEARRELSDHYFYKLHGVRFNHQTDVDKHFITDRDLRRLQRQELPEGVKS